MTVSLSEQAYHEIRQMIVRLDLAPGAVIREDDLQATLSGAPPFVRRCNDWFAINSSRSSLAAACMCRVST